MSARLLLLFALCVGGVAAVAGAASAPAGEWIIEDPGQGVVELPADAPAHELSGIAWLDGDRWVAVSDDDARVVVLQVAIDPADGRITSVGVERVLTLANGADLEGIAVLDGGTAIAVADERPPSVRVHRLADGALLRRAEVPAVFAEPRRNLGFESLTAGPDGDLWTVNEEALPGDGPTSTATAGTLVRILRFDGALRPAGQWAYRTDPVAGAAVLGDRGTGVSDLVALPDGRLIALERSCGSAGLRIRLYAVDLAPAAEVSALATLPADVAVAGKRLLWEYTSRSENFEGAGLGPPLADGSRSLVLISDDGYDLRSALYPLRLYRR